MKHPHLLAALALAVTVACSVDSSEVNAAENQDGSQAAPSFQDTLGELGSAAKDKAVQFGAAFREELSRVDDHLAELAKKLEGTEGATREKLASALAELEEKRKALGEELTELGQKGGEKLEAAKLEIERATAELAQDLARALEKFE